MRTYYSGKLGNIDAVIALSRIGKVSAASTATTLVDKFKVEKLFFTGVAGAVSPELKIGDIVVASSLLQHDVDASAIMGFKKFEIPLLGKIKFDCDATLIEMSLTAASDYIKTHPRYNQASIHSGLIASGDQFINTKKQTQELLSALPDLLAIEMEGAAVAQVCYEWNVPFVIIRTISDNANHDSVIDFTKFINEFAAPFSEGIILNLLNLLYGH